jgi:hypothetical protein
VARTGGRTPYDKANAATGPARVLWADPAITAVPADLAAIVDQVATAGEYPAKTGWTDFGLAADAPSYSHDKDTEGLEYQQPTGLLFEQISEITRQFTAQVAEIDSANLQILENTVQTEAVAASAAAAPAASKKSAAVKVHTGLYSSFRQFRIALISYRPDGAGVVTEPGPPVVTRPPAVARIIPLCTLAAEESELEFERGEPVNAEITFTIVPDTSLAAGKEHGYWLVETPGAIAA